MTEQYLNVTSYTDSNEVNDLKAREKKQAQMTQRRKLEAIYWGGVLLWAGLAFAADGLGILPQIGDSDVWSWVFFGAGAYGLSLSFLSRLSPDRPNPTAWDYIWSGSLFAIGLGGITTVDVFWPLVLIAAGMVIFGQVLFGRD
ncbi:MAG TPA: hypothetical protein VFI27_07740 [candidate division Zixibacteria bacterium]|nr:hypothetical protein [candidate division Zixibacteria bacterium]